MDPYVGIIVGVIVSTLIYVASGFIDIYWFSKHRRREEERQNKKLLINFAIIELELNHQKINNFVRLLAKIDTWEIQNRLPFNLELEIKEKYEIYTQNYENLFFSNISFPDDLKKDLLSVNNKLLEYKNVLYIVSLYATQNAAGFDKRFWDNTRVFRSNVAVRWLTDLGKIDEFINKLKNLEIE